jgi:hypothetical protein
MTERILLAGAAILGVFVSLALIKLMPVPSMVGDYALFFFLLFVLASSFICLVFTGACLSIKESNHAH